MQPKKFRVAGGIMEILVAVNPEDENDVLLRLSSYKEGEDKPFMVQSAIMSKEEAGGIGAALAEACGDAKPKKGKRAAKKEAEA